MLGGARILVADDEVIIALDMEAIFLDAGAEVVGPCTTHAAAVAAAGSAEISAAVLDIRLGRETSEEVAAILLARHIPYLFCSGQALSASMRSASPDAPLLTKPIRDNELVEAVAALLQRPSPA